MVFVIVNENLERSGGEVVWVFNVENELLVPSGVYEVIGFGRGSFALPVEFYLDKRARVFVDVLGHEVAGIEHLNHELLPQEPVAHAFVCQIPHPHGLNFEQNWKKPPLRLAEAPKNPSIHRFVAKLTSNPNRDFVNIHRTEACQQETRMGHQDYIIPARSCVVEDGIQDIESGQSVAALYKGKLDEVKGVIKLETLAATNRNWRNAAWDSKPADDNHSNKCGFSSEGGVNSSPTSKIRLRSMEGVTDRFKSTAGQDNTVPMTSSSTAATFRSNPEKQHWLFSLFELLQVETGQKALVLLGPVQPSPPRNSKGIVGCPLRTPVFATTHRIRQLLLSRTRKIRICISGSMCFRRLPSIIPHDDSSKSLFLPNESGDSRVHCRQLGNKKTAARTRGTMKGNICEKRAEADRSEQTLNEQRGKARNPEERKRKSRSH
ncbi:glycosyl transferase group 1 [Striga asiatica]|uniref:Glycosyl transferase group 1 n=1 Tax=Striga asiatica TaxID=4170 RepID=A0A5A7P3V6_STRAF|nr:glycosyl transferase group 1 [Striga asiatica]